MAKGVGNSNGIKALGGIALIGAAAAAVALLSAPATAQQPQAPQCNDNRTRRLEVQNLTPQPILYFQTRGTFANAQWGDDMLGRMLVPAGQTILVSMPNDRCQCSGDVLVTLEADGGSGNAGQQLTYTGINYCAQRQGRLARLVIDY